ncbi:MAG: hypothetical protein EZS28_037470 [Streblomastix strix]|uniref:Uncharacterized protein n=1 Tax=Streblomastix strix TaxID=222440 RepID=A0A5J4UAR7_9EUKA|nr:MAG: hypothetical protein EZS28_037470 [Streblomastix strix]
MGRPFEKQRMCNISKHAELGPTLVGPVHLLLKSLTYSDILEPYYIVYYKQLWNLMQSSIIGPHLQYHRQFNTPPVHIEKLQQSPIFANFTFSK